MSESIVTRLNLPIKGVNELQEKSTNEIDLYIDEIISKHSGNANKINMLLLDSVAMLSVAEARSDELASQGKLKKLWNGISGKNKKIRAEIDSNLASAQYASQQMIQKLAEQNLLSFELITTVNNKLNTMMNEVEQEINVIYETLVVFFKQMRSELIKLESRVEKLEQNINLLHWHNTVEYRMAGNIEYSALPEEEKIIYLANDFYHLTKAQWSTADLMLLKSTMTEVGIDVKKEIQYRTFLEYVFTNKIALQKLLDDKNIQLANTIQPYQASLIKGIEKYTLLQGEERYVVDSVSMLASNNDSHSIKMSLLYYYLKDQAIFDIDKSITTFDLINELLLNMSIFFNVASAPHGLIVLEEYEENIKALQNVINAQNLKIEEHNADKVKGERVIVRFNKKLSNLTLAISNGNIWGQSIKTYYLKWSKNNGDLVHKDEVLGFKKFDDSDIDSESNQFTSPAEGRLFIFKETGKVKNDEIIAVIGNPQDNPEEIRTWVEGFDGQN